MRAVVSWSRPLRFAVLSDLHGNLRAFEAVLAHIRALGDIEQLVVAGDLLSGPLEPSKMADALMAMDARIIRGNHERQLLACAEAPGGASAGVSRHAGDRPGLPL